MNSFYQKALGNVVSKVGKPGGWPSEFQYDCDSIEKKAMVGWSCPGSDKKKFRAFDCWGFAYFNYLRSHKCDVEKIYFTVDGYSDDSLIGNANFEALKRRISYLSINNPEIKIFLSKNGSDEILYDQQNLYSRPVNEISRDDSEISDGNDNSEAGRLEKDLQEFLFNGPEDKKSTDDSGGNTSNRLAILGEDFYKISKNLDRNFRWICREHPTGVFQGKIGKLQRVLPTEFIDMVALNKYGRLSVIELKVNDSQLEVISQLLDYALFIRCYCWEEICTNGTFKGRHDVKKRDYFSCYVVNNYYHPKFNEVFFRYYAPKDIDKCKFNFSKLTLGYTENK